MLKQFKKDLEAAKPAEELVLKLLQSKNPRYNFTDVSNDCSCYHKGDIKATSKEFPVELYIEVKDDSRIADTKRVLCEEEVYIYDSDYTIRGNMYNTDTDFYCVVSKKENCVYIFDYKKLQAIYKNGDCQVIKHPEQESVVYLVALGYCKRKGALIYKLNY